MKSIFIFQPRRSSGESIVPLAAVNRNGALIGDSRLAQGYGINGGSSSVWPNRFGRGPQHWLSLLSEGRVQFPNALNRAVGGNDLAEILDTLDADIADQISGGAGFFGYLAGVNSFRANASAETVIGQEQTIMGKLKATGLPIIVFDDWPGAGPTYPSDQAWWDRHLALRAHRRANYRNDPAITYVDGFSILSDPSQTAPFEIVGSGREDLYQDTYLHLSPRGAHALITPALLSRIAGWFDAPGQPAVGADPYGNTIAEILNANPTVAGTGGTVGNGGSGSAAPNWSYTMSSGNAGTQVLSKSTIQLEDREITAQRSVITATATAATQYARFGEQVVTVTPGQKVMIIDHIEVAPGATNVRSVEIGITASNNTDWTYTPGAFALTELIPATGYKGRIVSEVVTIPEGVTSVTLRHRAYYAASGAVSLDVKFGECYLLSVE